MNTLVEELTQLARALPAKDRARIAEELLASLDDAPEDDADAIDAAWSREIERRVQEIRNGTAELVAAEDVYAELRRRRG